MRAALLRFAPAALVAAGFAWVVLGSGAAASRAGTEAAIGCGIDAMGGVQSEQLIGVGQGVIQPFDLPVPAESCTLGLHYGTGLSRLSIRFWDPLTLAPRASTIALRTGSYTTSALQYNRLRVGYVAPLVAVSSGDVAEKAPTALALDYSLVYLGGNEGIRYWTEGPSATPVGYTYSTLGRTPLPGNHPVVAHHLCPAEGELADVRVVQSVITSDGRGDACWEYVQRFRVPNRCRLQNIELAFGTNIYTTIPFGSLALYDVAPDPEPGGAWSVPLVTTGWYLGVDEPTWAPVGPFPGETVLEPGRDYWLYVQGANGYPLQTRVRHADDPPAFRDRIGPLYVRYSPVDDWHDVTDDRALDFRIIGWPLEPLAVAPPAPARGLRLAVEPNPATSVSVVRWAGATGGVRCDVLDARGRRVARFEGAGGAGSWEWRGASDAGAPLPAGVYFVRVVDRAGHASAARVVRMR